MSALVEVEPVAVGIRRDLVQLEELDACEPRLRPQGIRQAVGLLGHPVVGVAGLEAAEPWKTEHEDARHTAGAVRRVRRDANERGQAASDLAGRSRVARGEIVRPEEEDEQVEGIVYETDRLEV